MTATACSPLSMLIHRGIAAARVEPGARPAHAALDTPSETVEQIAAGLLVAMGMREVASDLDLHAVALLGAACVVGLQAIGEMEPAIHRPEAALRALEDLLRRTAPAMEE